MKHFRLKFNYGVEIGAYLAYSGHFARTGDARIEQIANEEKEHRDAIGTVLWCFGEEPSRPINLAFAAIGNTVKVFCRFCPLWSLDLVARSLEAFAVFSYRGLAKAYPDYSQLFNTMADKEAEHERYFK